LVAFLPVATKTKEIVPTMGTVTIIMVIVGGFGVVQATIMDIITTAHMAIGDHPTCVVGGASGRLITIITPIVVVEASVGVMLLVVRAALEVGIVKKVLSLSS